MQGQSLIGTGGDQVYGSRCKRVGRFGGGNFLSFSITDSSFRTRILVLLLILVYYSITDSSFT